MNLLRWMELNLTPEASETPRELKKIIDRGLQEQSPFYFLSEEDSVEDTDRMNEMFTRRQVKAFARRRDYDGVICLVTAGGDYPKGHILILHWDGWPGAEVDDDFPSLAEWAKDAEIEIARRTDWVGDGVP